MKGKTVPTSIWQSVYFCWSSVFSKMWNARIKKLSILADRGHVSICVPLGFSNAERCSYWIKRASTKNYTESKVVTSSVAKKNYYTEEIILCKKRLKKSLIFYKSDNFQSSKNGRFWTFCERVHTAKWQKMAYFGVEISKIGNLGTVIRSWL